MKKKTVLILCTGIDDVISGSSNVAGIQVQLGFWARMFASRGWSVYALTEGDSCSLDGIEFLVSKANWLDRHGLSIVHEFTFCRELIKKTKADLVIYRGASRYTYAISLLCSMSGARFMFFGAHDTDFVPDSEIISGKNYNKLLYRKSIPHIDYFITQNKVQAQRLKENYGRDSLIVQNIWPSHGEHRSDDCGFDVVMVANLRRWKRTEWFVRLAEKMPERRFAFAGGADYHDRDYFDEIKAMCEARNNITFFGPKPFEEVNEIIGRSRLLVCTSTAEGFPNTFLQAWSAGVPVVSTVNPNNVVSDFGLGRLIETEDDLYTATTLLLEDTQMYVQCKENIASYFDEHHSAEKAIDRVLGYIGL